MKLISLTRYDTPFTAEDGPQVIFPISQQGYWLGWESDHHRIACSAKAWLSNVVIDDRDWLILGREPRDMLVFGSLDRLLFFRSLYCTSEEIIVPDELDFLTMQEVEDPVTVDWCDSSIRIILAADSINDSDNQTLDLRINPGVWRFKTVSYVFDWPDGEGDEMIVVHVGERET